MYIIEKRQRDGYEAYFPLAFIESESRLGCAEEGKKHHY